MDTKSVVITGYAGFIGSYLTNYYCKSGYKVIGIDKRYKTFIGLDNNKIEKITHDITKPDIMKNVFEYIKGKYGIIPVVHLAADPDLRKSMTFPVESAKDNIIGTLSILEAMRHAGFNKIVFASSGSVYGSNPAAKVGDPTIPESNYAETKLSCENYLRIYSRTYNFDSVACRFFNVFGATGMHGVIPTWLKLAQANEPLIINGDPTITRDYIYVKDLVRFIKKFADRDIKTGSFEIHNLGYGKGTTLDTLSKIILAGTDSRSEVKIGPAAAGDVKTSVAVLDDEVSSMRLDLRGFETGVLETYAGMKDPAADVMNP